MVNTISLSTSFTIEISLGIWMNMTHLNAQNHESFKVALWVILIKHL